MSLEPGVVGLLAEDAGSPPALADRFACQASSGVSLILLARRQLKLEYRAWTVNAVIRLRRVVLKLARQLNAASREEGLTPTQASVLGITTMRGPLSLAELTELEGINPTMLSRVIGKLDEYGLLKRLRDPDDFRAARVEVTPKGRGVYERITAQRSARDLRIRVRPARRSAGRAVRGAAGAGKPGRGPAGHGAARPGPAPGLAAARLTRSAGS